MTKINISKIFFTDINELDKLILISLGKNKIGFSKLDISISVNVIFTDYKIPFTDIEIQYQ